MSRYLPVVKLQLIGGLNTNFNPEEVGPQGLLQSKNADGYSSFRSWGKIPGSTRKSYDAQAAWKSLHYYEYFDLTGTLQRDVVGLAGTKMFRIGTDLALENLGDGYVSETLRSATMFDRIHFASPNNDPFKFDGQQISKWGVDAPGQEQQVILDFDTHTDWVTTGPNTVASSTTSKEGTSSTQINKLSVITTEATITDTGLARSLAAGGSNAFAWLFLPAGSLNNLRVDDYCVRIEYGDAGFSNTNQHDYFIGQIQEGWNLLSMVLATPTDTAGTGADLSAVDSIRFTFHTQGNSITQSGVLWDKFFVTDAGFPTPSLGAAGSVLGNVSYRITYLTRYGLESNAGPPSVTLTADGSGSIIVLNGIPTSPDSQVIARRIYRDAASDSVWRFVAQVNDNDTTTYSDNTANESRSLVTPPLAASATNDNSPPPRMSEVFRWKDHIWGIDVDNPFQINISLFNGPDAWPLLYPRQFDGQLVGINAIERGLLLLATDQQWLVRGENFAQFFYEQIHTTVGATGKRSHTNTNRQLVCWHDDGMYLIDGFDPWYLGSQILDLVKDDLDPVAFADLIVVHDRSRFRVVVLAQTTAGGDYDRFFSYGYGKQSLGQVAPQGTGVHALDVRRGVWSELDLPSAIKPLCASQVERSADLPELWVGCDDGHVYHFQDPAAVNWANNVDYEPVECTIETVPIPLGESPGGEGRPRFMTFSVECTNPSVWTITVSTLKSAAGGVIDSTSFDVPFPAGPSDAKVPIPKLQQGEYAKVLMSNANKHEDGIFHDVSMAIIPRSVRGADAA